MRSLKACGLLLLEMSCVNIPCCLPQAQVMNVPQNCRPAPYLKHRLTDNRFFSLEMRQDGLSWGYSPIDLLMLLISFWSGASCRKGLPSEACSELPPPTGLRPGISMGEDITRQPAGLVDRLRGLAGWWVEKEIGLEKDNRNWPSKLHLNLIDIKVILWFLFVA